jgi:ribosomal protein S11
MYAKTYVRRSRKDVAEKLLDQLNILTYNNWPLEIYEKHRRQIEQLDPHQLKNKPKKYTAYQAFKEALISYYTGIAINVIHKKAEGETCYLDATAGIGILPLHIKNNPYPVFGSAIIPLITPTIGEQKFRREPKPFKYIILAEKARARRELLRKVVQEVEQKLDELGLPTPDVKFLDDINAERDTATRQLTKQCGYVLAVVDPTGAEINGTVATRKAAGHYVGRIRRHSQLSTESKKKKGSCTIPYGLHLWHTAPHPPSQSFRRRATCKATHHSGKAEKACPGRD